MTSRLPLSLATRAASTQVSPTANCAGSASTGTVDDGAVAPGGPIDELVVESTGGQSDFVLEVVCGD